MIEIIISNNLDSRQTITNDFLTRNNCEIESIKYTEKLAPYLNNAHISISHTENVLVVALSKDHKIGIDIENKNRKIKCLTNITDWTMYEAYGKYLGVGITKQILSHKLDLSNIHTYEILDKYIISLYTESKEPIKIYHV